MNGRICAIWWNKSRLQNKRANWHLVKLLLENGQFQQFLETVSVLRHKEEEDYEGTLNHVHR